MKKNNLRTFPYITLGIVMAILSNPLLYIALAAFFIDVRNLFGAHINRATAGFDTNMPLIQAMSFVSTIGIILIAIGLYFRRKR